MKAQVIDLETTVKNKIGNNKASAFCKDNYIVLGGNRTVYGPRHSIIFKPTPHQIWSLSEAPDLLIGQNIGFDLHHIRKSTEPKDFITFWKEVLLWDVGIVEYMITGQQHKFPSLDELATKYGGTIKNRIIKEIWEAGVQTEDINEDILREYLEEDLRNTELVFKAQLEEVQRLDMLPLVWARMGALKATIEMEWNGLHIDVPTLDKSIVETSDAINTVTTKLLEFCLGTLKDHGIIIQVTESSLRSNKFISTFLYGGEYLEINKVQIGEYKTGKNKGRPKFTTVTNNKHFSGILGQVTPTLKVDEETLLDIRKKYSGVPSVTGFINRLLEYRKLGKELNTYLLGIKELVFDDGKVHGNINHTATHTGRLSSSNPNLQNFTNKE